MSLQKAIEKAGGVIALANELGISRQAIYKWNPEKIPIDYLIQIEKLTGISREKLRPELFK